MSRPRKPTAVLELNGAFQHDPQRKEARANEPDGVGELGSPPTWMTDEEKKIWRKYKKTAPWLTASDELAYIAVVKLTVKIWSGTAKSADFSSYKALLSSLGLTAADRSKVNAAPKKTEQPHDEWTVLHRPGNTVRTASINGQGFGLHTGTAGVQPISD
jgi:hypothetical protein